MNIRIKCDSLCVLRLISDLNRTILEWPGLKFLLHFRGTAVLQLYSYVYRECNYFCFYSRVHVGAQVPPCGASGQLQNPKVP